MRSQPWGGAESARANVKQMLYLAVNCTMIAQPTRSDSSLAGPQARRCPLLSFCRALKSYRPHSGTGDQVETSAVWEMLYTADLPTMRSFSPASAVR